MNFLSDLSARASVLEHSSGAEQSLSYWQRVYVHAHAHIGVCHIGAIHWCSEGEREKEQSIGLCSDTHKCGTS